MSAILILGTNEATGKPTQTWLDDTDIESIIARSSCVRRTHRGIMQDQYETLTHVLDEYGNPTNEGPLMIVANHYSRSHESLEAARRKRRTRKA